MIPVTTRFAQRASTLLREGKNQEACALCEEGTKRFPWYASGYVYLGRCYEALGRVTEALMEYRKAWSLLPDNQVVIDRLNRAMKWEEDAFAAFASGKEKTLAARKGTMTFSSYLEGAPPMEDNSVEVLAKQLQGVKRIVPEQETEVSKEPEAMPEESSSKIVTPTLAEIYAAQGQYTEAAAAYRRLAEGRPEEATRYLQRADELEALARAPH